MGSTGKSSNAVTPIEQSIYGQHEETTEGYWEDTSYFRPGTREWHEPWTGRVDNMSYEEQMDFYNSNVVATDTQKNALDAYAMGTYQSVGKDAFARQYDLADVIDKSTKLHLGNATLYRGADLTDKEFNDLTSGKSIDYLSGVTSWSVREDVAHMYAQGDNYTGETYRTMYGGAPGEGHKVVFIEKNTNDSMALPSTSLAESLRSPREYRVTKIVPLYQYKKVNDPYSAKNSGYDEPVTYVYVTSKKAKR